MAPPPQYHSYSGESTQSRPLVKRKTESRPKVTILSIDGGGMRGIIPAVILHQLEIRLKNLDGPNARVAEYFDIIAGTSTGSILTAMLTIPDKQRRPKIEATKFASFYEEQGKSIFGSVFHRVLDHPALVRDSWKSFLSRFYTPSYWAEAALDIFTTRYGPSALRKSVKKEIGDLKLQDTVTKVVIPTFFLSETKPVIFTSDMTNKKYEDVKLADVVLASSAAPSFFPPHKIKFEGKYKGFLDGGLVANNPTLAALCEATTTEYGKERNYDDYLVLSLGTGRESDISPESNQSLSQWFKDIIGNFNYLILLTAVSDAVELYMSRIFHSRGRNKNYLRIQEYDEIKGKVGEMDDASQVGVMKEIANKLLDKDVQIVNPDTGNVETQENYKYKDALTEFAEELVKQKKMKARKPRN